MAIDTYMVVWQRNDALLQSESLYDPSDLLGGANYPFTRAASPLRAGYIFELSDFSFDVTNPVTFTGSGGTSSRMVINPLKVSRPIDIATPTIFANLAASPGFKAVDILQVKSGQSPIWYAAFGLMNVYATAQSWSHDDETLNEELTFICSRMQVAYRMQKPDGSLAAWLVKGWDTAKNGPY